MIANWKGEVCIARTLFLQKVIVFATILSLSFSLLLFPKPVTAASLINVTTFLDQFNSGSECSLREAIYAANTDKAYGGCPAGSGVDYIILASGVYHLSILEAGSDQPGKGDLDIIDSLAILGQPGTRIVADTGFNARIFHIKSPTDSQGRVTRVISITIANLEINGGRVDIDPKGGGGILNEQANVQLSSVLLKNNIVTDKGVGGGISNLGVSTLSVINSSFISNSSGYGGAIYNEGLLNIYSSLLNSNTGAKSGGGIDNNSTSMIVDTTISNNSSVSAEGGGAGIANSGNLTMKYDTITGNVGIGIKLNVDKLTIQNSIIANHQSGVNCQKLPAASFKSKGNNLADNVDLNSGDECKFNNGTDIINQDAMLATTLTTTDTPTGYYAFANPSSPAINHIPVSDPSCNGFDQRGKVRPDGSFLGCDIGSYEQDGREPLHSFLPSITR